MEIVADGSGTNFDASTGRISLEQGRYATADRLIQALAHEIGHAYRTYSRQYNTPTTPAEYERISSREEANAQWHSMKAIDEVYGIDNVATGLFGLHGADYVSTYKQYSSGAITQSVAVGKIAALWSDETPSGHPGTTYLDSWKKGYNSLADKWNQEVDKVNTINKSNYEKSMNQYNKQFSKIKNYNSQIPSNLPQMKLPFPKMPSQPNQYHHMQPWN